MRAAEYVLLVAFVFVLYLACRAGYEATRRKLRKHQWDHQVWHLVERDSADERRVLVVKQEKEYLIGSVPRMDPDYMDKLLTLRSEAESKRDEWNVLERGK